MSIIDNVCGVFLTVDDDFTGGGNFRLFGPASFDFSTDGGALPGGVFYCGAAGAHFDFYFFGLESDAFANGRCTAATRNVVGNPVISHDGIVGVITTRDASNARIDGTGSIGRAGTAATSNGTVAGATVGAAFNIVINVVSVASETLELELVSEGESELFSSCAGAAHARESAGAFGVGDGFRLDTVVDVGTGARFDHNAVVLDPNADGTVFRIGRIVF